MTYIRGFIAGFISTLVFHQGLLAILYAKKIVPFAPYNMAPTHPFGVPSVISLSFFGGLWGALIARVLVKSSTAKKLVRWIAYGAAGPTAVAIFVVFPLKGLAFNPKMIPGGLLLNGVWGLGCFILMQIRFSKQS